MGEQNRRAVELEPSPVETKPKPVVGQGPTPADKARAERALGPEADERQTLRMAPPNAAPGESAEGDSIG